MDSVLDKTAPAIKTTRGSVIAATILVRADLAPILPSRCHAQRLSLIRTEYDRHGLPRNTVVVFVQQQCPPDVIHVGWWACCGIEAE